MNLKQIAEKGDKLATLRALRSKVAAAIDESSSGRDIAALTIRLMDIMDQINDLENDDGDPIGSLLSRRESEGKLGFVRGKTRSSKE